eukprot:7383402-Prymnesium_polylepis.1
MHGTAFPTKRCISVGLLSSSPMCFDAGIDCRSALSRGSMYPTNPPSAVTHFILLPAQTVRDGSIVCRRPLFHGRGLCPP